MDGSDISLSQDCSSPADTLTAVCLFNEPISRSLLCRDEVWLPARHNGDRFAVFMAVPCHESATITFASEEIHIEVGMRGSSSVIVYSGGAHVAHTHTHRGGNLLLACGRMQ